MALLALGLLAFGGCDDGSIDTGGAYTVSGKVFYSDDSAGIPNAGVELQKSGVQTASVTTDPSGAWAISGVENGDYLLVVQAAGKSKAMEFTVDRGDVTGKDITLDITPPPALPDYTMVPITGGTVSSPPGDVVSKTGDEAGIFKRASPYSSFTLSGYYMGETEVTRLLWYEVKAWAESTGYKFAYKTEQRPGDPDSRKPASSISWEDAVVWCNAYSEMSGKNAVYKADGAVCRDSTRISVKRLETFDRSINGYRLPTEAEWEYAARGGDPSKEAWNYTYAGTNDNLSDYAVTWQNTNDGMDGPLEVKLHKPNTAGLYDMSGNVTEWCWDRYNDTLPDYPTTDYAGPSEWLNNESHVVRGGTYMVSVWYLTVARRRGVAIPCGLRLAASR